MPFSIETSPEAFAAEERHDVGGHLGGGSELGLNPEGEQDRGRFVSQHRHGDGIAVDFAERLVFGADLETERGGQLVNYSRLAIRLGHRRSSRMRARSASKVESHAHCDSIPERRPCPCWRVGLGRLDAFRRIVNLAGRRSLMKRQWICGVVIREDSE